MITVYGRNNSVNVQKVMWCAGELGLLVDRKDIGLEFGGNDEDWYYQLNPNRKIPVLDDEGVIVWESHACVRYLAAKYGSGSLWAEDPGERSLADRWMDWKLGTLHLHMTPVFWGLVRTPPEERDWPTINANAKMTAELFALADEHLATRPFMAGNQLTIGDIPLGCATYRWYGLDLERPDLPHLRRWYEGLCERPAFRDNVMLPTT